MSHFTSGIWEEICQKPRLHLPLQNILHRPLVKEKNIITAVGFAFREFAEEVIRTLGIDPCEPGLFRGIYKRVYRAGDDPFYGGRKFPAFSAEISAMAAAPIEKKAEGKIPSAFFTSA